jgi:Fe-S cluster assembly protein SufD
MTTESTNAAQPDVLLAHQQAHANFSQSDGVADTGWLQPIRERAMQSFARTGFPTTRDEDWKYTNLTKVADRSAAYLKQLPTAANPDTTAALLARLAGISGCYSVVFANGQLQQNLSKLPEPDSGFKIATLRGADDEVRQRVQAHLGQQAQIDAFRLAALNTAFLSDGVVITVPAGQAVSRPIHVVFVATGQQASSQPRVLLSMGENSQAVLIEHHLGQGPGLTNAITEIDCAQGARIKYVKIQEDDEDAYHLAAQHVSLADGSALEALHLDLGSKLARNDLQVTLNGTGSTANLYGLFLVDGERHIDNHTRIDHRAEHTTSRESYRGVIDDRGRGVFNGKIIVHSGADQTDAQLNNRNLLLSPTAEVDTKPELEIYTDDVKCSHGTTTGQLDANAIFYLQARGIPKIEARQMLIGAFAREMISQIEVEAFGKYIETIVTQRLPD